jgi:D-lyxose ketol-isomerase
MKWKWIRPLKIYKQPPAGDKDEVMHIRIDLDKLRHETVAYLEKNGIILTGTEQKTLELTDFGLGMFNAVGLQIFVYVNTDRVCAKELIMLPHQICPEHRHPPIDGKPGKEETFRCRAGKVYLYIPGEPAVNPGCVIPDGYMPYLTSWKEIILNPGDQYTLYPDTLHWFQAGEEGALITEFSTKSADEHDIFTDRRVARV